MKSLLLSLLVLFVISPNVFGKQYKGAEIYSNESWKYGRMEMRMKMAKGSGILSTFFTYKNGSEVSGAFWEEIDIEVFGKENAEKIQTNIITGNPKTYSEKVHSPGYSMGDDFHTYVVEWTPNYVAWFIDGVEIWRTTGGQVYSLTNPQSFRFNIWASSSPEWVGPFSDNVLPAYQFVNWITYSSYTPGAGANGSDFTFQWKDDFDSFNTSRWSKANWTFDGNLVDFAPENVVVKDGMLVLAITRENQTGFNGTVPTDNGIPTGLWDISSAENTVTAFPNPFNDSFTITLGSGNQEKISIEVMDLKGRSIFKSNDYNTGENILLGDDLLPGIYIVKISGGKNPMYTRVEKLH